LTSRESVQVCTASLFRPASIQQLGRKAKHTPGFVLTRNKQLNIRCMSTSDNGKWTNNNIEGIQSIPLDIDNDTATKTPSKTKGDVDLGSFSLANLASSQQRFANSINMTPQQVSEATQARKAESAAFHERLTALNKENEHLPAGELGRIKHQMICHHRHKHLRKPFVCRKCWTHLPICVCPLFERVELAGDDNTLTDAEKKQKAPLPKGVERVVVWTHHEEWGRTSNTGSLLPLGLERTDMLMKGLDEHEEIMYELLNREDVIPVVLWPGKGQERSNPTTTVSELRSRFFQNKQNVEHNSDIGETATAPNNALVLISIEGTWNNARKMANRLPSNVLRLDLGELIAANFSSPTMNEGIFYNSNYSTALSEPASSSPSLLAPLRRQGRGKHGQPVMTENVSTLEATVVALLALGLKIEDASRILRVARTKIDRILEYSGKVQPR